MFCLYYEAATRKVHSLNGSGRSPKNTTLEQLRKELGLNDGQMATIPLTSVHAATIPGAAAGWCDTVEKFGSGKLSLQEILAPAIRIAEDGFPVSEITAAAVSIW
jgi:gamma-glutamyltranspeptidase / glutathione hydrolase